MLEEIFARARRKSRIAFVPYVVAGDPDVATTGAILDALRGAGADAVELGIPYGDPLADGPTIAAAAQRSLRAGTRIEDVLLLAQRNRERGGVPIVLFTYFNPVYQYGLDRFARDAATAGASGAIVPDIPLEEGSELSATLAAYGLDMPLLVAPSTTHERAKRISEQATGFIYVVSRLGVTGAGCAPAAERLRAQIATLREMTEKPLAVGFGVSSAEHVRRAASIADGVIVGSALIDSYTGSAGDSAASRVRSFVTPLVAATAMLSEDQTLSRKG
jgi:tryptophan synthase alpha chain